MAVKERRARLAATEKLIKNNRIESQESLLTARIGKIFAPRAIVCSAKMRYTIHDGCKRKACAACRDRKTY